MMSTVERCNSDHETAREICSHLVLSFLLTWIKNEISFICG